MVTVPQRYDDPSGKPLQLAVMRIAGDGAEEDPLILAQGGPGGSGLALAGFAKQIEAAAGGRDIILFDQRGARNSVPFLSCTEADKVNAATVSEPLAPAIETAQLAVAYGACAERFRAEGYDPAAFGTDATAQDVRSIVTALGYDEYDFYGVSYGTQIGQALLRDHPEGLRSVILDGVDPLAINAFRGHGWSTTRAIDHLFAACAADAACAAAYPASRPTCSPRARRSTPSPRAWTWAASRSWSAASTPRYRGQHPVRGPGGHRRGARRHREDGQGRP
ncbi:MAG: alpha/beta fold hydrolase [Chloroflexota bacterium]